MTEDFKKKVENLLSSRIEEQDVRPRVEVAPLMTSAAGSRNTVTKSGW